ncbi:2034_t:CDS:2 [Acaulospora morrowiae]|uniref:2034_t:CDS:1 n=1 Tax=Acaulospora morrowiae TaxID=94023 RepID=A0A9N9CB55_9GLOM|nr:2034_t:CDS:2 [Acaulospora morrowiae]
MGLPVYEEKMVKPSAEDVKKYKTVEFIKFLQGQDLELCEATLGKLKNAEVNGHDFLFRMSEKDFTSFEIPADLARRLAELAKEIRLGQKKDQESANDTIVDANNELSHIENLILADVSHEYGYEIPESWTDTKTKLRDLCLAKIIRVNDELSVNKRYDRIYVKMKCKVTSTDHGRLSISYYDAESAYENYCEILLQGNMEEKDTPTFDDYMEEFGKEVREEKIQDISNLPDLEKTFLNIRKVSQEHWPKIFDHSYRDIAIARDEKKSISIEDAIKNYRIGWKALHNKNSY